MKILYRITIIQSISFLFGLFGPSLLWIIPIILIMYEAIWSLSHLEHYPIGTLPAYVYENPFQGFIYFFLKKSIKSFVIPYGTGFIIGSIF